MTLNKNVNNNHYYTNNHYFSKLVNKNCVDFCLFTYFNQWLYFYAIIFQHY